MNTRSRCRDHAAVRFSWIAAAAVLTAMAAYPVSASAAPAAGHGIPPAARAPARLAGMTSAVTRARALRRPVVVPAFTTATSQVAANPDGTFTMTDSTQPVRVRAGQEWRPISPILRQNRSGTWSPQATPSKLILSGGGRGPMAVLQNPAGGRISLTFPRPLPRPAVHGPTATYRNVLPGVTLNLTATPLGGLTQTLVISSPQAADSPVLRALRLGLAVSGLHLAETRQHLLTASAPRNRTEFTGTAPQAWTSAGTATARKRPQPVRAASARPRPTARLSRTALTITTPAAALAPAAGQKSYLSATVTPDFASGDPIDSGQSDWTEVKAGCAGTAYWRDQDTNGSGAGYQNYSATCEGAYRTYFQIGLSGSNSFDALAAYGNIEVQAATFTVTEDYGADWGCSHTWPLHLDLVDNISSSTDWNNKPADNSQDQTRTLQVKPGPNASSGCSNQQVSFQMAYAMDIPAALANANGPTSSNDWSNITFGLSGDETASSDPQGISGACGTGDGSGGLSSAGYNCGFMRFDNTATIATTFDLVPPAPTCNNSASTATGSGSSTCNTQLSPPPANTLASGGGVNFGCSGSGPYGWINQDSATFVDRLQAGIDGEGVRGVDSIWDGGTNALLGTVHSAYYATSGTGGNYTDTTTDTQLPAGAQPLLDGHRYRWNATAEVNGDGTSDTGQGAPYDSTPSADCRFNVDLTPPTGLTVTSAQFPPAGSGQTSQDAGTSGMFTFAAADPLPSGCTSAGTDCQASGVYSFTYTLNAPDGTSTSATVYPAAASSPGATQTYTAIIGIGDWGTNVLTVTAKDNAGNIITTPLNYTFYAPWNNTTQPASGDINGDGIPDLLATTGSSLILYPGDTDPSAPVEAGAGCGSPSQAYNGPCTASPIADSPDGKAWNTYLITHRGSMSEQAVDDLFAAKGANLYLLLNNPSSSGSAPQYAAASGSLTTIPAHPVCTPTPDNAGNCATYPGGTSSPNTTSWSDLTQVLAPGDAWTGSAADNGLPSLLTVENGQLWLYQAQFGPSLGGSSFPSNNPPVLLGSSAGATNWAGMTLIAPGTVNGDITIWARDNATGTIYSYPITIDANGYPTLNPSSPGTPVTATSGTTISGVSLPQGTYPALASPGALDNSSYPGLYAESTTGPSGSTCTNGCLWYYPGQSASGGDSPLTSTPVYAGTLRTPASQLS